MLILFTLLCKSSSKPSSAKTVIDSTTMENISEAQHDQSIISTSMSSQNIQHSTSVSQEPIFIAQNVDTDPHNNDIDQDVSVVIVTSVAW